MVGILEQQIELLCQILQLKYNFSVGIIYILYTTRKRKIANCESDIG